MGVLLWQALLMGLSDHRVRLSGREVHEGPSVEASPRGAVSPQLRKRKMSTGFPLSVIAQTCPAWCCLVPALRASSSETSESTGGVTSLITVQTAILCVPFKKKKTTQLCSIFLQVWGRSPREFGDRHVGLAVAVGDCDWLLLLHLRRGTAEFDRSSPSSAGHRQRQHRACSAGQCPQGLTLTFSLP